MVQFKLISEQSLPIYQNLKDTPISVSIKVDSGLMSSKESAGSLYYIREEKITKLTVPADLLENPIMISIPAKSYFMVINMTPKEIVVGMDTEKEFLEEKFDSHKMASQNLPDIDPESIKAEFTVPLGYIDVLNKWYSVKFTYPDYNLIFVHSGCGISWQTHKKRKELWEVIQGDPYIIVDNRIDYQPKKNEIIVIDYGMRHTILNPTNDWAVLKEKYEGTFDEMDIEREFNPNRYFAP